MSTASRHENLLAGVIEMLLDLNSLRVRLADGSEHYVLIPDTNGKTWHISKPFLKAIKAKEVRHD
jgi:hypothetical protein